MKKIRYIISLLLLAVSFAVSAQDGKVKWSAKVEHEKDDVYSVLFNADIESGWHMYDLGPYDGGPNQTEFTFELPPELELVGGIGQLTKPHRSYDDLFDMEIGYFEKKAVFRQKVRLKSDKGILKANVEWMVCDDSNCLPPDDHDFTIEVKAIASTAQEGRSSDNNVKAAEKVSSATVAGGVSPDKGGAGNGAGPEAAGTSGDEGTVDEGEDTVAEESVAPARGGAEFIDASATHNLSIWQIILAAMKWALLAIVSPCVFPMIPMTVSFFLKNNGTRAQGRFKAVMYGVFIILLYTLPIAVLILMTRFLGGDNVTADIFNWLATHWLPNTIFFLVFMTFAASFFGAFEITLPSSVVNKSDKNSDRAGLVGVFFMALTLVLVSFSCTGPLVGSAIVESTSGGVFWSPIVTMLAFSVVFALPFMFFAFFPSLLDKLPKSGGWLNSVKVVLGFIEVALGLKFLSVADQTYHWGILDREVYLAIWITVFALMGFYLLGKIRFKHDSEVKHIGVGRLSLVIITFAFVVYLIPGMFGAPLKALSGYLPPIHTQDFIVLNAKGGITAASAPAPGGGNGADFNNAKYSDFLSLPHGLSGFFDLEEAQAYADKIGKPLFVDITGHGCVNCREMEARVWSDPQVLELLRNEYVIVALYLDDKKVLPESEWLTTDNGKVLKGLGKINSYRVLRRYGVNAQPYYVLQGRGGELLAKPRGYDLSVPGFVEFLKEGVEAYKAL